MGIHINKLTALTLVLLFTQSSFATSAPDACPAINALKSIGFTSVRQTGDDTWQALANNYFDTDVEWTFATGIVHSAANGNDALAKANALLARLSIDKGPEKIDDHTWICWYKTPTPSDPIIFALTPADSAVNYIR